MVSAARAAPLQAFRERPQAMLVIITVSRFTNAGVQAFARFVTSWPRWGTWAALCSCILHSPRLIMCAGISSCPTAITLNMAR